MSMSKEMNMLGRILYGLPMAVFAFFHFTNAEMMKGMVPSFLPGGVLWVYITGAVFALAAYAVFAGKHVYRIMMALAFTLGCFIVFVHLKDVDKNMTNLLKDMALAGAALYFASTAKDRE